jgi:hypothetical protein
MLAVWNPPADAAEYRLMPDVTLVLVEDGTARLLNMGGSFFALSESGTAMIRGLLEMGRSATVGALADRYQVRSDRIEADVDSLLEQLLRGGLLQPLGQRRRGLAEKSAAGSALLIVPCLGAIRALTFGWVRAPLVLTLAKLAVACFGWARTVAAWQRALPRFSASAVVEESTVRSVDRVVCRTAAGHPLPMACKERGLSCWTLASWAGVPATLVIGIELFPLGGHCWCEAGPFILSDHNDRCEEYVPVIRYGLAF